MFTGIIENKTKVISTSENLGIKKVEFEKTFELVITNGSSVSIDGVCSTVTDFSTTAFSVDYMPETLSKTTMKNIVAGNMVNIERSLKAGDPIDGHFVYGHVDCVGIIDKVKNEGGSKVFSISISKEFHKYVAYKGSVALNGVSLTISNITKRGFEVSLIPYTLEHTTFGDRKVGDMVNVETDIIARYLERIQNVKVKD